MGLKERGYARGWFRLRDGDFGDGGIGDAGHGKGLDRRCRDISR